jgi:predicted DCC family thiol-disulfide oxidoreductase YuxK
MGKDKTSDAADGHVSDGETSLIYDGECPVCIAYSETVETGEEAGGLRRINARSDDPLVQRATEEGLDLDDGMVLVHQGKLYHGADALHMMAKLAPKSGLHNRLNRLLFGSRTVSHISYPLLRAGRNMLLRLRGKAKIGNLDSKRP